MDIKYLNLQKITESFQPELDEALQRVVRKGWFLGGDETRAFEAEFAAFCGSEHCLGVANGLDALYLALRSLKYLEGWADGDEVIVPAYTFIASVEAVSRAQLTPILCDVREDDFLIDCDRLESLITPRTRAIMPVHLFGKVADMERITALAGRNGLRVVEDCAQAHGARFEGRNVGTLGELACFSFYPGKNLYAFGEGGSVVCNREDYWKHMTRLKNQGCDVRYYHDEIGYNYRLEGLQAAVLSVSLRYLPQWTGRRQEIGRRYLREIQNPLITMQKHPENTESVFHLFVIQVPDHNHFIKYMEKSGVECNMHYPVPCHLQNAYAFLGGKKGDCPNAERLAEHCVTLPLFPEMREEEVTRVIELCNAYLQVSYSLPSQQ